MESRITLYLLLLMFALNSCTSLRYAGVGRVRDYCIESLDVPEEFDGYRIAFASDFHLKSKFKERQLRGTVKALNALAPDVLMLGGDYQEGCEYVEPLFMELARVTPPDGIYAVLGNNDYERCTELIRASMQQYGIHLLEEEVDTLRRGDGYLIVWGANPYAGRYPTAPVKNNPFQVSENGNINSSTFVVLLTHTPDFVEELEAGVADIALAGHTHGGQVTLLGLYAPVTSSRYGTRFRTGLRHSSGGVPIVISGGLGTSRYPIRFCAPTDIVVITLRRKK